MAYPTFLLPNLSAEDRAYIESILHPKVKADADGNCLVNAAKIQEVHSLLDTLSYDLDRINCISRKMLSDAVNGKDHTGINIAEHSRLSAKAKRTLYDINVKFEDAFSMNNSVPREETVPESLNSYWDNRALLVTTESSESEEASIGPQLARDFSFNPLNCCERFAHETKQKLALVAATTTPPPLPPISIKHAEEEEDLYA